MVSLVAKSRFTYAGKVLRANETFDASTKDAKVLKIIGRAMDAPPVAVLLGGPYPQRVAPVVEEVRQELALREPKLSSRTGKPKRKYKRKDMTAED